MIEKLQENPTTRRAIAVTWIPPVDTKVNEVPCMMLDDFKIRDGKIHLTTLFRSHDFGGPILQTFTGSRDSLSTWPTGWEPNPERSFTISISAHIYDHDWDLVENIIKGLN